VPRPYLDGAEYLAAQDTSGSAGYVAGIAYTGGRWWFWPLSLMIKWPGTALLLLVAGAAGCLRLPPDPRRRAGLAVGLPAILLTAFTLALPRDIGVRYLLPVLALWAAAAACGLVTVLADSERTGAEAAGRSGRRRVARRGGRRHRRVIPALRRVGGLAVPAGLCAGDRFRSGLGPGPVRAAFLEREPGSVGGLLRAPRHHHG